MVEKDVQDKLDKLARLEASTKERSRRYLDKVKDSGKVQISGVISAAAFDRLCRLRDQGMLKGLKTTTGTVIENLLMANVNTNVNIDTIPEPKEDDRQLLLFPEDEIKSPDSGDLPDSIKKKIDGLPAYHGQEITTLERDIIVMKVADRINEGEFAQVRADVLNYLGVTTKSETPFTKVKATNALYNARKRAGKS